MDDTETPDEHVKPFVYETLTTKALHFSICEIQSRMQTQQPHALDLDYTQTMMGFLLFNSEPDTIAMIGLGGGSLAKFCHRYLPRTRIKVVEINPHVIALRDEFQVPRDDERFAVLQADGADFVRFPPYRPDVLLVDGYDSEGLPPALSSQRFYDDCFEALQPGGLLVLNLHTGHREHEIHLSRIRTTFGDDILVVPDRDCSNTIVFARRGLPLRRPQPGVLRRPRPLAPEAWDEIQGALSALTQATASEVAWP